RTTASTPYSVSSACHSRIGVAPARATARAASRSSSEPGKVTTPTVRPMPAPSAPPAGSCRSRLGGTLDPHGVVLDDRIGEQLVGDDPDLVEVGLTRKIDLDPLSDAYRRDTGHPEAWQRVRDRLSLRIMDFRFE